jgi:2-keto-3-deoxy-6-phosphogluconate aldolase
MQEAEADLENLRIMGLAIAGLRIALAGGVDERGACQWWYAGYVAKVCMAVGGRAEEEKVESREWWVLRSNVAHAQETETRGKT